MSNPTSALPDPAERPSLRVGLASFGRVSQVFHAPLVTATSGLELAAIASSSAQKVADAYPHVRHVPSAEALVTDPDVDIVVVTTPNDSHVPLALAAIEAGRHVVVEKPIALDADDARRLVDAAAASKVVVTAFHNRRWDGDLLTMADVLHSGRIGRPVTLHSHFDRFRPEVTDRWRDSGGAGSGLWLDLGPHLVDQAVILFGRPRWIQGDLATIRQGARADDYAHVVLGYEDGLRVVLHATTLAAATPPRFVLHGTAGSFVVEGLDPQEDQLAAGRLPGEEGYGLGAADGVLVGASGQERCPRRPGEYQRFYALLRDAVLGAGPPPVDLDDALTVMEILDLARRSGDRGSREFLRT